MDKVNIFQNFSIFKAIKNKEVTISYNPKIGIYFLSKVIEQQKFSWIALETQIGNEFVNRSANDSQFVKITICWKNKFLL